MLSQLQQIARICTKATVSVADVIDACGVLRHALAAEDAYVVRAGDPDFIRMGCGCDPAAYEIKQKGYWIVWRQAALNPQVGLGMFDVADRLVSGGRPLSPGIPTTHLTGVLPADESNSEMLIVRGPWREGLTDEQIRFVEAARLILAHGVSKVLDAHRRDRQREQLESLANVSNAFNEAGASDDVLTALSTALAKASTIDWVVIELYNDAGDTIIDRALNIARFSETKTANSYQQGFNPVRSGDAQLGVVLARTGEPFLVRDVHAPDAWKTSSCEAPTTTSRFESSTNARISFRSPSSRCSSRTGRSAPSASHRRRGASSARRKSSSSARLSRRLRRRSRACACTRTCRSRAKRCGGAKSGSDRWCRTPPTSSW